MEKLAVPGLALHGFLGSPYDFPVEVHTPYWLPAHGPRKALETPMSLSALARDFDEICHPQSTDLLMGYSLGGRVLMTWAVEQSKKGSKDPLNLILISTSPGINEDERPSRMEQDARWAQLLSSDPLGFTQTWKAQTLFSPASPERVVSDPVGQARLLLEASPARSPSLWSEVAQLKGRIVYICGSEDKKYLEIGRRLVDVRPETEVVIVPGAHHDLHLTHARELSETLKRHLHGWNKN